MIDSMEKDGKLIMCFMPKGACSTLVEKLFARGITRANLSFARGFDIHSPASRTGLPNEDEKEILTVAAKNIAEANDIFHFIYEQGEMDHMGGGLMVMMDLKYATPYVLPEIEEQSLSSRASGDYQSDSAQPQPPNEVY